MTEPIYACPYCDTPAWRTRYMLWRHMSECLRKTRPTYAMQEKTDPHLLIVKA